MMSLAITVVQETRTERVLEALRDLTSPRALVIRDGERKRIAGREVVRGDWPRSLKVTASRPTPCCSRAMTFKSMNLF
jgi:magnesium-transporting ATPase (P-type)